MYIKTNEKQAGVSVCNRTLENDLNEMNFTSRKVKTKASLIPK